MVGSSTWRSLSTTNIRFCFLSCHTVCELRFYLLYISTNLIDLSTGSPLGRYLVSYVGCTKLLRKISQRGSSKILRQVNHTRTKFYLGNGTSPCLQPLNTEPTECAKCESSTKNHSQRNHNFQSKHTLTTMASFYPLTCSTQ